MSEEIKPKAPPRELPAGWFAVDASHPGHKGIKEDVLREIEACVKIDTDYKTFLLAAIRKMPAKAVEVHVHCTAQNGSMEVSTHLKPLF